MAPQLMFVQSTRSNAFYVVHNSTPRHYICTLLPYNAWLGLKHEQITPQLMFVQNTFQCQFVVHNYTPKLYSYLVPTLRDETQTNCVTTHVRTISSSRRLSFHSASKHSFGPASNSLAAVKMRQINTSWHCTLA